MCPFPVKIGGTQKAVLNALFGTMYWAQWSSTCPSSPDRAKSAHLAYYPVFRFHDSPALAPLGIPKIQGVCGDSGCRDPNPDDDMYSWRYVESIRNPADNTTHGLAL